ncbi:reverse transcriptase-like protein [Apostichopus japonicus]|uniref:Reverse transcriptase-like protein n=1 Tax=Stichopus japonicus TaxID=307972 RepID=A0A2G8JZN2_STIJA|nr:reverse transcriptase-like protein [Apostichopus japonicus]
MEADVTFNGECLSQFEPTNETEIRELILRVPNKSCSMDPLPTWILKRCVDVLLPIITAIVNKSLAESLVPPSFKQSCVTPLLKKTGLNKDSLLNYRPVSQLPFVSKLVERVVANRLSHHLAVNALHDTYQSAYRQHHSTESALLKVHNDIAVSLDSKFNVALILLDLSAAFDVIDHQILFQRLEKTFGVTLNALSWFKSYMTGRKQWVKIGQTSSTAVQLSSGVPQGSVLGPIIYCMFTKPLCEIIKRHQVNYHCYADDTQLYLQFDPKMPWTEIQEKLQECVNNVGMWLRRNKLMLNDVKTELIIFSPKTQLKDDVTPHITVGTNTIYPASIVKNLGVYFDSHLTMETQVNHIIKSCYFHIRNIGRIRDFITTDACKILVQSLVTSRSIIAILYYWYFTVSNKPPTTHTKLCSSPYI